MAGHPGGTAGSLVALVGSVTSTNLPSQPTSTTVLLWRLSDGRCPQRPLITAAFQAVRCCHLPGLPDVAHSNGIPRATTSGPVSMSLRTIDWPAMMLIEPFMAFPVVAVKFCFISCALRVADCCWTSGVWTDTSSINQRQRRRLGFLIGIIRIVIFIVMNRDRLATGRIGQSVEQ